jgi:hypothetical protein
MPACLPASLISIFARTRHEHREYARQNLAIAFIRIIHIFFLIKEAFIRTSEAIHRVDTKPKRTTSGLCLTRGTQPKREKKPNQRHTVYINLHCSAVCHSLLQYTCCMYVCMYVCMYGLDYWIHASIGFSTMLSLPPVVVCVDLDPDPTN